MNWSGFNFILILGLLDFDLLRFDLFCFDWFKVDSNWSHFSAWLFLIWCDFIISRLDHVCFDAISRLVTLISFWCYLILFDHIICDLGWFRSSARLHLFSFDLIPASLYCSWNQRHWLVLLQWPCIRMQHQFDIWWQIMPMPKQCLRTIMWSLLPCLQPVSMEARNWCSLRSG